MDERLKGLKKAMQTTTFKDLSFTEQHKQAVQQQVSTELALTELLALLTTPKTGIALTETLHQKGVTAIQLNEGLVYTLLHEAELKGYLEGYWSACEKYYQLTKKGLKVVQKQQAKQVKRVPWAARLQEMAIHE